MRELHREFEAARRALPLERALGGLHDVGLGGGAGGGVDSSMGSGVGEVEGGPSHTASVDTAGTITDADPAAAMGALRIQRGDEEKSASSTAAAAFERVLAYTCENEERAFAAAMKLLEAKLCRLNGEQDETIREAELELEQARLDKKTARRLPERLSVTPAIQLSLGPDGWLICARGGATMRASLGSLPIEATQFLVEACATFRVFASSQLPCTDEFEQLAACSRLLSLGVLCDADALRDRLQMQIRSAAPPPPHAPPLEPPGRDANQALGPRGLPPPPGHRGGGGGAKRRGNLHHGRGARGGADLEPGLPAP